MLANDGVFLQIACSFPANVVSCLCACVFLCQSHISIAYTCSMVELISGIEDRQGDIERKRDRETESY